LRRLIFFTPPFPIVTSIAIALEIEADPATAEPMPPFDVVAEIGMALRTMSSGALSAANRASEHIYFGRNRL